MPLTAQGYEARTLEEVNAAIAAEQLAMIAADLDLDPDEPLGQMNVIVADDVSDNEEALAVAYGAFDRGNAEGRLLDNLGDLVGVPRDAAQHPRVVVRVQLTYPNGLTVNDSISPVGAASNAWYLTQDFTPPQDGSYYLTFQALNDSQSVPSFVSWNLSSAPNIVAATNLAPSSPARTRESDADYRTRQDDSLTAPGAGSSDSLATDLRAVPGVQQATVYENPRSFDLGGLPPHSFECVIYDGQTFDASNDAIAQVIWDEKPPGSAYAFGLINATAYDLNGQPQIIKFSRASQKRILISFTLQVLPGWKTSQLAALRTAIVQSFQNMRTGQDLPPFKIKSIAGAQPYAYNVTDYTQGIFGGPYVDDVTVIATREIATMADADLLISVQQLTGTP